MALPDDIPGTSNEPPDPGALAAERANAGRTTQWWQAPASARGEVGIAAIDNGDVPMPVERLRHVDCGEPDASGAYDDDYEYDIYRFTDGVAYLIARSYTDTPDEAHFLNIDVDGKIASAAACRPAASVMRVCAGIPASGR